MKTKLLALVMLVGAYFAIPPRPINAYYDDGSACSGAGDCTSLAADQCGGAGNVQAQCCCGVGDGSGNNYCGWVCVGGNPNGCSSWCPPKGS